MAPRPVIDMRSRPALLHPFYGSTPGTDSYQTVRWLNARTGSHDPEHFARSRTLEGYVHEVAEAGITTAVVVGRDTPGIRTSNDVIAELVSHYPGLLVGVGAVDPQSPNAVAEVARAVTTLGLKGINLEPAFMRPAMKADDPRLYPVYSACQDLAVPVFLMSGPTAANLDYVHPVAVGTVAAAFPRLTIVCYHGFYPFIAEIIAIAFKHPNVHVVPDMYTFAPGGGLYLEAANGFMQDQFLFGTAYPFRAMGQSVEDFLASSISERVLDKVLYRNALRVLGISLPQATPRRSPRPRDAAASGPAGAEANGHRPSPFAGVSFDFR